MFNWIKRKTHNYLLNESKADIQNFIDPLKGGTDDEIGFLVAHATKARLILQEEFFDIPTKKIIQLSDDVWNIGYDEGIASSLQFSISRHIRGYQKSNQPEAAAQMMVWLHTLRCGQYIEMRYLGQEMWRHLSRGFIEAEHIMKELLPYLEEQGVNINYQPGDCFLIPLGFETKE